MQPITKIAQLLRTPEKVILNLVEKMEKITSRKGVMEKIIKENNLKVNSRLKALGINPRTSSAESVYQALQEKTKKEDEALFKLFRQPEFDKISGCRTLVHFAYELASNLKGFFLKKEKAKELLNLNPPKNIIKELGYKNSQDLLANEEIEEIFAGLRFAEDINWLNDIFFKPYQDLKKNDFEERTIEVRVLSDKWRQIGEKFAGKKLHHISHLKELGLIFVIPFKTKYAGATLEVFTLVLHYLHEVDFYSMLFKKYSQLDDFNEKMILALRGQVGEMPPANTDKDQITWQIIQRYLAKENPLDPKLFQPHINPEVIHWLKAEMDLKRFGERFLELDLEFFGGLDWVGQYFEEKDKKETLVSFDLIDNLVSLTRKSNIESKYLYHQQEALWNKIFAEYLGEEELERLVIENLDKGYISLSAEMKNEK